MGGINTAFSGSFLGPCLNQRPSHGLPLLHCSLLAPEKAFTVLFTVFLFTSSSLSAC